ncbi:hypothetical protein KBX06_03190 [Micromonospora sp. C31]|uniref:hypothetical protein n=1 Tax=Micromonospora sp. C31 TaxID=2824876 RepID=UPI001B35CE74|nr:hypothetical protein [Micromonospora sp. C31]MBQ1072174.1 hypothetical protein [Micromonospora sp. C31]
MATALSGTSASASPHSETNSNGSAMCALPMSVRAPLAAALPTDENAQADALNTAVIRMRQAGRSQAWIDRALSRDYGLDLVGERPEPGVSPFITQPSNLSVPAPSIYRDTCTGKYSVFAYWNWNSIPRLKEDANSCSNCAVGGYDVMGISLTRDVSDPGGYSAQSWGATNVYPPAARNIGDTSNHGFAMQAQDRFCKGGTCSADDYNMYHGQLVMGIDSPGCGALTAHSKYGHSRTGATLSGVSVGFDSIGISWSNNNYAWEKANAQASNTVYPC